MDVPDTLAIEAEGGAFAVGLPDRTISSAGLSIRRTGSLRERLAIKMSQRCISLTNLKLNSNRSLTKSGLKCGMLVLKLGEMDSEE